MSNLDKLTIQNDSHKNYGNLPPEMQVKKQNNQDEDYFVVQANFGKRQSIEDLKTINLQNCQVKIIDFGFATVLNSELTFTALGTPDNMDPKMLAQFNTGIPNTGYHEKVDIWSLGTLCYEMVGGK